MRSTAPSPPPTHRTLAALLLALAAAPSPGVAKTTRDAAYPLPCAFGSRTEGLDVAAACAAEMPGGFAIAPAVVAALAYERGLASLAIRGKGWFYRRRDGRMARMEMLDNGPDPFADGLARATIGGRLVYVDRRLRVRIATPYDWGTPFARGRADVCTGCAPVYDAGGEHSVMTGGRWAVIDRRGREIATRSPARQEP